MMKMKACLIIFAGCGTVSIMVVISFGLIALGTYSVLTESTPKATTDIEAALNQELSAELGSQYHRSQMTGDTLVVDVTLKRDDLIDFWESLALIHGAIAKHHPPVEQVIIEDTGGQRITVLMEDLRDYYSGRMGYDDFRDSWQVTNP